MLSVLVGFSGIFTVQFPYLETSKIFKECRQGGVGIHLVMLYKIVTTVCAKTLITYIKVIVPGPGWFLHLMNKHSGPRFHLTFTITIAINVRIQLYNNVVFDTWNSSCLIPRFFLNVFSVCTVSLAVVLCYMQHLAFSNV